VVPIHSEVTSWEFRLRIYDPSPAYSPPATSGTAANSEKLRLTVLERRAHMVMRLTAMRTENRVETMMQKQIEVLGTMPVAQLRQKYLEVFGEEARSTHRQFLFRRIAWRVQAIAEGGLSERARRRALEIANDADLRLRAPRPKFGADIALDPKLSVTRKVSGVDPRLPPPGTYLEREFKGRRVIVKVLVNGFEFDSEIYKSLSAVAQEVTGTKWNGFLFFNLNTEQKSNGQK
jgi:hypothetical protein